MSRIAHAYLFTGPRGVGKTTMARIFAKALNCPNVRNGEPCNVCDTCREIAEGRCIDIIEIDGASNNGVEQVRTIRDAVRFLPAREKYKMYIIDEVHMLTTSAFNALLKTLEEPPAHAIFIFATTEAGKLPATVISRCQRYDFRRISVESIVSQLSSICTQENLAAEPGALYAIAKQGDGSMRDAESIFDQVVAFCGGELTYQAVREALHVVDQETFFRLTDLIHEKDTRGGFVFTQEVIKSGYDVQEFLSGFQEHLRNLLVVRTTGETDLVEAPDDIRARYTTDAPKFTEGDILRLLRYTADTLGSIRNSVQPRLKFEIAVISMIKMDSTVEISSVLASLSGGTPPGAPSAGRPASSAADKTSVYQQTTASASASKTQPAPTASRDTRERSSSAPAPSTAEQFHVSSSLPAAEPVYAVPPHPIVTLLMESFGAEILPSRS